jgi:sodium/bile acid cotransporter 7
MLLLNGMHHTSAFTSASFKGRVISRVPVSAAPQRRRLPPASPLVVVAATATDTAPANTESAVTRVRSFASKNFFILGTVATIAVAAACPSLGVRGGPIKPEVTIDAFAVSLIFLLNGLSLPSSELAAAAANIKLNGFTQFMNLAVAPLLVWPLCGALRAAKALPPPVVDGLMCTVCLPTTVNMCIVLTGSAGGNVATALFNAVVGNILGIFATPLLIFKFLGAGAGAASGAGGATVAGISYLAVLKKLSKKVLLPVAAGQALRLVAPLREFRARHKKRFSRAGELLLLSIIYTTFCDTFAAEGSGMLAGGARSVGCLLLGMPALHLLLLGLVFAAARLPAFG